MSYSRLPRCGWRWADDQKCRNLVVQGGILDTVLYKYSTVQYRFQEKESIVSDRTDRLG
jgi:hypothetical protein